MKPLEINIENSTISYIQFLHNHVQALKEILVETIMKNENGYNYNVDVHEHFMNEYKQTYSKYNLANQEILKNYAPQFLGSTKHTIEYDFERSIIIIKEIKKNNSKCKKAGDHCGI